MKKLIVITGADGTGKSTLIKTVLSSGIKAKEASIWDAMDPAIFQSKKQIDDYLKSLLINARLLFLSHAIIQSYEKALKSDIEIVLFNAYYYKYFASELSFGANPILVQSLIDFFPKPDLVIELILDVEKCYERKKSVTNYECGFNEPNKDSFIRFQTSARAQWNFFDTSFWKQFSTMESPGELSNKCIQNIEELCR